MLHTVLDCFVHPIKSRLLLELYLQKEATAKQLAQACSDVPQATLYRYLNRMQKDGAIEVVSEHKVRGVIEKVYRVRKDVETESKKILEENSGQGYFMLFVQFVLSLLKEFRDYAERPNLDLKKDGSGFSVCPVYATTEELVEASRKIGEILLPLSRGPASPDRKMHTIAVITAPPKDLG